jgi:hypothetical protein
MTQADAFTGGSGLDHAGSRTITLNRAKEQVRRLVDPGVCCSNRWRTLLQQLRDLPSDESWERQTHDWFEH